MYILTFVCVALCCVDGDDDSVGRGVFFSCGGGSCW